MGGRAGRAVLVALAAACACAPGAAAQPVRGRHETVDNRLTTTRPNAPTGSHYKGSYHAAGDPSGSPPYMRRMTAYQPRGFRYDPSVPARCTATDLELEVRGASACPAASRVGGGTTQGKLFGSFGGPLTITVFNNVGEQIFLVGSPGLASVARGKIGRDSSITFASPTCYPAPPAGGCPIDNALQLGSDVTIRTITRTSHGRVRSYLTTPPTCPASGHWSTPFRFWWADGSVDTVVTRQPCVRPRA